MINIESVHLFSQIFRDAAHTLLHLLCLLTKHNTNGNKSFRLKELFPLQTKNYVIDCAHFSRFLVTKHDKSLMEKYTRLVCYIIWLNFISSVHFATIYMSTNSHYSISKLLGFRLIEYIDIYWQSYL